MREREMQVPRGWWWASLGGEGNEISEGGMALPFLILRRPVTEEEGNKKASMLGG